MMASLYKSLVIVKVAFRAGARLDLEDANRGGGAQLDVVPRGVPEVACVAEQIVHLERARSEFDPPGLGVMRIGVHDAQYLVVPVLLAVREEAVVVDRVESERVVALERRVLAADAIETGDE